MTQLPPDGACACPEPVDAWSGSELERAARLQHALLPRSPFHGGGWTAAHRYAPAGLVGGDILDLVPAGGDLYFVLADVSGKGIAASLLTTYLHAVFRTLIPFGLPVEEVVRRASALLCASTLPAQYATLVFGVLRPHGEIVLANAGHPPPFVVGADRRASIVATGTAVGLFCDSQFGTTRLRLSPGETLLLYSDGVTEAFNATGQEYGPERLQTVAATGAADGPETLVDAVMRDHTQFLGTAPPADDLTLLAVRRAAQP